MSKRTAKKSFEGRCEFDRAGTDSTSFHPFKLIDCRSAASKDLRLVFDRWEWLEGLLGGAELEGDPLNGYMMERLVMACRHADGLPLRSPSMDYNSEAETCLVHFRNLEDAVRTAELVSAALKTRRSAIRMLRRGEGPLLDEPAKPTKRKSTKPMKRTTFWKIIADSAPDPVEMAPARERLRAELGKLAGEEILAFVQTAEDLLGKTFTWDLHAAADLVDGGCSDYSFRFFGLYLVANGKRRFERALRDADSLADWVEVDDADQEITEIAAEVYRTNAGGAISNESITQSSTRRSGEPCPKDQLHKRLPKLTKRFAPNLFPKQQVTNRCPECKQKLRTNAAKQCFACGADWH